MSREHMYSVNECWSTRVSGEKEEEEEERKMGMHWKECLEPFQYQWKVCESIKVCLLGE